ncbi:hypothetical protein BGZ63DRAFT_393767 [Mariannaea sp. PMI_226]|nr:hypothetical protein BGZ63DRAFT_393767 [Mariannaea sp. PMI_226]
MTSPGSRGFRSLLLTVPISIICVNTLDNETCDSSASSFSWHIRFGICHADVKAQPAPCSNKRIETTRTFSFFSFSSESGGLHFPLRLRNPHEEGVRPKH